MPCDFASAFVISVSERTVFMCTNVFGQRQSDEPKREPNYTFFNSKLFNFDCNRSYACQTHMFTHIVVSFRSSSVLHTIWHFYEIRTCCWWSVANFIIFTKTHIHTQRKKELMNTPMCACELSIFFVFDIEMSNLQCRCPWFVYFSTHVYTHWKLNFLICKINNASTSIACAFWLSHYQIAFVVFLTKFYLYSTSECRLIKELK